MKALTAAEMREVDRLTTERYGVPSLQLMEAAGTSVCRVIRDYRASRHLDRTRRIVVLCGKGNNGGDGVVSARHLQKEVHDVQVRAYLFGAAQDCKRWTDEGGPTTEVKDEAAWRKVWEEIAWADIVVDALLGTGLRGGASGLIARAIEDLNRLSRSASAPIPALILAVDTPSGLPSDGEAGQGPVLRAHKTITFTAPKVGQLISSDAPCCGELLVRMIGSPPALVEETGKGNLRLASPDEFASL